jgi:hypothetical protein
MIAMHAYIVYGMCFMTTGQTFGDTGSPGNFEAIPLARQQVARHLWHDADLIDWARSLLPAIEIASLPSMVMIATFTRATVDSFNSGVLHADGRRKAPTFDHLIDDLLSADTGSHLLQLIAAMVVSLYEVFGYPNFFVPDPLSREKFKSSHTHRRCMVGWIIDTWQMIIELPGCKRSQLVLVLDEWLSKTKFTLREAAELHGKLNDVTFAN